MGAQSASRGVQRTIGAVAQRGGLTAARARELDDLGAQGHAYRVLERAIASTPPFRSLGETGSASNAQRCAGSGHMLVGPGALWGRAHSLYLLREAR